MHTGAGLGLAAACTLLLPLAGCGSAAKPAEPSPAAAPRTVVSVYYLRGEKLAAAHRSVPYTRAAATAALRQLLSGPTAREAQAGFSTAIPAGTRLRSVVISGGIATVDLGNRFAAGGGSFSIESRLAEVTFTLTQFPTVQGVVLARNGQPVPVFSQEGLVLDQPLRRSDFEDVTPAVLLETPAFQDSVRSPLRLRGTANTFEATFTVELKAADGALLATRTVHASAGTGTRGTFDASLAFAAGRRRAATLTIYTLSPRDGSRAVIGSIPLTLAQ